MFAIMETGGKQYCVRKDSRLFVEKLPNNPGDEIKIDKILYIGGEDKKIGAPYVDGATVTCEVLSQERRPKVLVFKRRRRKDSKSLHGHRQDCTVLRVKEIVV